jgi:transformation/transcription domain-associated protein
MFIPLANTHNIEFVDLTRRLTAATELRDMIDNVRDTEATRVYLQTIPALLELLRSNEPAFQKDALEYQFRRVVVEILQRLAPTEGARSLVSVVFPGMLHLLRHDNEEIGVACCKTLSEIIRTHRTLPEDLVSQFMVVFQALSRNIPSLAMEYLSESSVVLDVNVVLPSMHSFKVLKEMGIVVSAFMRDQRQSIVTLIQNSLPLHFEVLAVEAPAQKKAREDFEAMGGFWSGMSGTIRNAQAYSDLILAQVKVGSSMCPIPLFSYRIFLRCCPMSPMYLGVLGTNTSRMGTAFFWRHCDCYRIFLHMTSLRDGCALRFSHTSVF